MNYRTILGLLIVLIMYSCSQRTSKGEQQTFSENSTQSEATPKTGTQIAKYIRHIFQDKNGNFWFGTNNYGVAHFNGDSISYFSVEQGFEGGQITGITEDLEKNIWFATDRGVVKYDWSTTENGEKLFINHPVEKYLRTRCWSILSDSKGNIWAGTEEGVFHFNGRNWKSFELPYSEKQGSLGLLTRTRIFSISEDNTGNIWFGTDGNGAIKYNGKSFIQYTVKDGLADKSVFRIMEDRNANIWLGTWNGGLSKFNGETFTNYTEKDSIGNNEVCIVFEDNQGNIWLSSEGFGVYRFDGKSFSNYSKKQGLDVMAVQTIYEDQEGRLWVGGGGGLYRFDGNAFINVTKNGPWK